MQYLKNHKKVCGIQNIQREESNEPPHKEGLRKVLEVLEVHVIKCRYHDFLFN